MKLFKTNTEFKAYLTENKMSVMSKDDFYSNFDEEYQVLDDIILNGDDVFIHSNRIVESRNHTDGISTYTLIPLLIEDETPFDGCVASIKTKHPTKENIYWISQIPSWHTVV